MNDLEKAARMALEALEDYHEEYPPLYKIGHMENIITALRQALEQPAQQQEPVAWWPIINGVRYRPIDSKFIVHEMRKEGVEFDPLYPSPLASKPWVGLTDEDIHALMNEFFYKGMQPSGAHFANFARAIEAKLKEKNAITDLEQAALAQKDPCPGCRKGSVCRTPACGRLKLPVDHPYRTGIKS